MEIGASAGHENRRHVLMQCYDEVVRKAWAEKARRGDVGFDVNTASLTLDLEALKSAGNLYDTLYPKLAKSTETHSTRPSLRCGGKYASKFSSGMRLAFVIEPWFLCMSPRWSQARAMEEVKERASEHGTTSPNGNGSSPPNIRRSGGEMSPGTHGEM